MKAIDLNKATLEQPRKPGKASSPAAPVALDGKLEPLKSSDFAKTGIPFGLSLEKALEPLPRNDLAAAAFHSGIGKTPLEPLTKLDFIPGTRENAANNDRHEQITEQAQNWVAQTFFGTLMKQMRNSPFKSELFSGGRGGEVFGELFDQQIADRMAGAAGSKLVKSIVRQIEANKAYGGARNVTSSSPAAPTPEQQMNDETNPFKNVRIHVAPDLRG